MKHHGLSTNCRQITWCAAVWLTLATNASAEIGTVSTFPGPRTRMRNGLTVEVDTRGVAANGYRTVRVKVINTPVRNKPPVPVTADRRLRVVLEPSGTGHLSNVATSQVIEIPEKQSSAVGTIAIPSSGDRYSIQVTVYEGGDKLDDVSDSIRTGVFVTRTDAETLPTLLLIDYDVPDRAARDQLMGTLPTPGAGVGDTYNLPDLSNLLANFPYTNAGLAVGAVTPTPLASGGKLSDTQVLALAAQHAKVQLLPPAELPKRWIELSCYDIAFVSLDDLAKMARQDAPQRQALVDWLHGGPALVVYGAGDDFSRLAEIEKLLDLQPLHGEGKPTEYRGWTPANNSDRGRPIVNYRQQVTYGPMGIAAATTQAVSGMSPQTQTLPQPNPMKAPMVRRAGLGWVVAIADDDPFPGTHPDWNWVINSIPTRHQHWVARHGMSYQTYNQGLWNWYIPGVGAAPVFSFLLLATLFAIVIGPVNYLFLGRIQRLYLLLVTVPAGAAVVTLGLFAYAVLSDGLGVKARIRSFSLLDQKSGRTVSWSRQSYYASLVPSQGLKYPADAVVWPLDERTYANRPGPSRQVAWEADGQRLKSGYLSSRRLTQLVVIRAGKTKAKMTIAQKAPGAAPQVTSGLEGTIERLVLCDSQGEFFETDSFLKPGESATLKPLRKDEARRQISQLVIDHRPEFPVGYDPVAEARRTNSPWNRMYWGGSDSNPVLETSILETNLGGLQTSVENVLTPGTYFALLETNPDVPLGIPNVDEAESFHVIVGRW